VGDDSIPDWLTKWGGISWRLIAIGVVVYFGFQIFSTISVVVLAFVVAMFLAAVLWSPARWLSSRGLPPALASLTVLIAAALLLVGVGMLIVPQIASNFDTLSSDVQEVWDSFQDWLITGPLGLSESDIDSYVDSFTEWLQGFGQETLLGGATAVVEFVTGFFLALIITFFLVKDGRRLLDALVDRLPEETAAKVQASARIARSSLAQYMGGIAIVGAFDATLIAVALWIVGAPLVLPLALLVFLGAYIPLVGAFVSGLLAVAVTLVNVGLVEGLIVLAVTVAVQQFEGDVIMPLVFGQTLKLHPLVILLGVTAGGLAFGLFGAFLSVPLIAVAVSIDEAISDDPESGLLNLARG
jgi:predicted PurR-regulated permease PerM